MAAASACPLCGNPLPADGPAGQCPACLLQAALSGQSEAGTAETRAPGPAAGPAEAGARLRYFGDYELLEEIARGGMGVVWKARQTSLNRPVALKMIRDGALAGPDAVARFLREAEAAANLQHPNIVAIHEVGEYGGQHYFSMEYVAGRDLGSLVKDGPLPPRKAAEYVRVVAEAIQFAHQRGTLHRDLKPQNVIIDAADQPHVTDFGLAKFMTDDSRLTQSGAVMGSPSYMPPEQASGRRGDVGPASDVYSLGAMLYELLTGRPPFRGASPMDTLVDVLEAEPTGLRKLRAEVPPDLETVCLKCLEKSPSARYPTARALADELGRFLNGEPIEARPAGLDRKVVSWVRRHPGLLAAAAALAIVALAFGAFYLLEENAFLRAQHADPTLARAPGPRRQLLQYLDVLGYVTVVVGCLAIISVRRRSPDLRRYRPGVPLNESTRRWAIVGAMVLTGYGFVLLVVTIQANVWEGEQISAEWVPVYGSIYFGLTIFGLVVRDYRLVHHGASTGPGRPSTADPVEPIRRAMEDWNIVAAIKLYRAANPDATLTEAKDYVIALAQSLQAEHPGKFVPPDLSLTNLNWTALLVCSLIEGAVLLAWRMTTSPAEAVAAIAPFGFSLLFGMGVLVPARLKRRWSRTLVGLALVALVFIAVSSASGTRDAPRVIASGVVFGFLLMVAAYTPRRRRTAARP